MGEGVDALHPGFGDFVIKAGVRLVICHPCGACGSFREGEDAGLVDGLVSGVASHLADGVLQHHILLEEVVDRYLVLGVVVHRALEEEAQEALDAVTAVAGSEVAEQHEVEAEGSCED